MKRRLAPALIAMMLGGALAAQAQAQPHGHSLSLASGKAAIERFAGKLTYELAAARSATPMSWQVSACRKQGAGLICAGEWIFAGEKCSVAIEALTGAPSTRVKELGRLQCSKQNDAESSRA